MKTLFILFCSAACLLAQNQITAFSFADQAFMGNIVTPVAQQGGWTDSYYPTNIPSAPAYTWWVANGHFSSSSGNATLTNLSANSGLDLTNLETGTGKQPVYIANGLNGFGVIKFDGSDDYLKNTSLTSTFPCEIWLVMEKTQYVASQFIYDSAASPGRIDVDASTTQFNMYNSGTVSIGPVITNRWFALTVVFGGESNDEILTNNVLAISSTTASAGYLGPNGLTLGARYALNIFGNQFVAEMAVYKQVLTATMRSNLFNYLTNKYGFTQ